ncbi:16S rRNA (uracil(1498)-N(3))-methyltransferase [Garciella nitratireducens]|uniref:Ribosomal RNA small subunit methyltransferase E n=1 Tax=Garciella nitratireducens DSM 15102 TaxID=1121911 RepID=A0A1T4JR50_9FIRM|nr:16S rRNA (uracil(1498)-N(3))-methyltransferase [Garciella nitratireducens]RBP45490.1 16S rRNA (uracil1498-N3)-methyltransferase [Garciella nitratireducens]SJZ32628.1 16S rRNA (uracil1498-N3)-methyltransferase [Garciella nitratireducens DSM 15102]
MHRFFVNPRQVDEKNKIIEILGDDVKHISKVLRLKEGQEVEICDGKRMEYYVVITKIKKDKIYTSIKEMHLSHREPNIQVILYQGLPKSTKMDLIIQKCTELGIYSIIPIQTDRTVIKIENSKLEKKKIERWQRICYEAAKQSKRGKVPHITEIKEWKEIWEHMEENDLNIIAYENEKSKGLKQLLKEIKKPIKKIGILIGPEGGFTDQEIQEAQNKGIISISLGPRILRTETAGFATVTMLMYALGDLGGY